MNKENVLREVFAQFVFKHFGGWWLHNDPLKPTAADLLPRDVEERVVELVRGKKKNF